LLNTICNEKLQNKYLVVSYKQINYHHKVLKRVEVCFADRKRKENKIVVKVGGRGARRWCK